MSPKNAFPLAACLAAGLLFASCASTEFLPYEGRTNVFEGKGGTKSLVGGVEFWEHGDPPRTYQVLGIIVDARAAGYYPGGGLRHDVAKKAKELRAHAVILLTSDSRVTGMIHNATASTVVRGNTATTSGSGYSMAARQETTKYAVVRYVD